MKYRFVSVAGILLVVLVSVAGGLAWHSKADANPATPSHTHQAETTSHTYQGDHFTIQLPDGLKAEPAVPDARLLVTFESANGLATFQVFTEPFSGPLPLTPVSSSRIFPSS